jgi:23S rRNA pseudouridine1911/1915/1917 synthase
MGQRQADKIHRDARVAPDQAGQRLDQAAAALFTDYSRSRLQVWIRSGELLVDGRPARPRDRLRGDEYLELRAWLESVSEDEPEPMDLDIVHEDDDLLVINKSAGVVVHPAAGHADGTLMNGLLHHHPALEALPRAGIVHRLDRDTTGLMVVAKTLRAHKSLVEQLQARSLFREYDALVAGVMTAGGRVDQPVGRHPVDRKRMAVATDGKPAVTHYRVEQRFRGHTRVRARLATGRTHQIRVHMAWLRHPLVGDPVYGGRLKLPRGAGASVRQALRAFPRQALHAHRLGLEHPDDGAYREWQASCPDDLQRLLTVLETDHRMAS